MIDTTNMIRIDGTLADIRDGDVIGESKHRVYDVRHGTFGGQRMVGYSFMMGGRIEVQMAHGSDTPKTIYRTV